MQENVLQWLKNIKTTRLLKKLFNLPFCLCMRNIFYIAAWFAPKSPSWSRTNALTQHGILASNVPLENLATMWESADSSTDWKFWIGGGKYYVKTRAPSCPPVTSCRTTPIGWRTKPIVFVKDDNLVRACKERRGGVVKVMNGLLNEVCRRSVIQ